MLLAGGCAGLVGSVGVAGCCGGVAGAGGWVDGVGSAGGVDGVAGCCAGVAAGVARLALPGTPVTVPATMAWVMPSVPQQKRSAGAAVAGDAVGALAAAGDAVAAAAGAVPLIAAANAVRLARAAVSLAFVSSSNAASLAWALAFGAVVPDVPVGFGSAVTLAAASPVAGVADSSSPKILSAAAASVLHFAADVAFAFAEASADVLAVIF